MRLGESIRLHYNTREHCCGGDLGVEGEQVPGDEAAPQGPGEAAERPAPVTL